MILNLVLAPLLSLSAQAQAVLDTPPAYTAYGCTAQNAPSEKSDGRIRFEEASGSRYRPCDTRNLGFRVRRAMAELKAEGRNLPTKNRYTGDIIGGDAYEFIVSRIKVIEVGTKSENCKSESTGAFFKRSSWWREPTMHICSRTENASMHDLKALLLHEARHQDEKPHVFCHHGEGTMMGLACDKSVNDLGSYAVTLEYHLTIANGDTRENAADDYDKSSARASAVYYLLERFNQAPPGFAFGAVVFPKKGGALFYDGKKPVEMLRSLPKGFKIASSGKTFSVYDPKDGELMKPNARGNLNSVSEVVPTQDDDGAPILDRVELDTMVCVLFPKSIWCREKSGANSSWLEIAVPADKTFRYKRFWYVDKRAFDPRDYAESQLYALTSEGQLRELQTTYDELLKNPWKNVPNGLDMTRLMKDLIYFPYDLGFPFLSLSVWSSDLRLRVQPLRTSEPAFVPKGFETMKIETVHGPMLWSPNLHSL